MKFVLSSYETRYSFVNKSFTATTSIPMKGKGRIQKWEILILMARRCVSFCYLKAYKMSKMETLLLTAEISGSPALNAYACNETTSNTYVIIEDHIWRKHVYIRSMECMLTLWSILPTSTTLCGNFILTNDVNTRTDVRLMTSSYW